MTDSLGQTNADHILEGSLQTILNTLHEPALLLDHELNIAAANEQFQETFHLKVKEREGDELPKVLKGKWNKATLKEILKNQSQLNDIEFTPEEFKATFLVNFGQINSNGKDFWMLSFKEAEKKEAKQPSLANINRVLQQAPALICTLQGPEHIFEFANDRYLDFFGGRELIGKPIKEVMPEIGSQGLIDILNNVYQTGEAFHGNEIKVSFEENNGSTSEYYFDFVYQPILKDQEVDGIFVLAVDISDEIEARKKAEKSEEELRNLIDTVPVIIWITDAKGHSTYLNKNWYDYTGEPKVEAEEFGWVNSLHPDDRNNAKEGFRKANQEGTPFSATYRLKNKSGEYRWVIDRGSPNYDQEGNYLGMVGSVIDIHEEKLKKQLVKEKEHRTKTIVEEATIATGVYIGEEMRIELANDAMIKVWGKDRSVIGKTLREALPELEGQPFHGLLHEVFTTGKTYWGKEDRVDLEIDGKMQTGYFNFTYKPLRNEQGEIYGILNMALDVTEMVKSKELIKESETHFRQMADLMPNKVTNTDAEGNFVYFNQNWLKFTGLSSENLKTKGWKRFIHPEERQDFEREWKFSLNTGRDFEMELRLLDLHGDYKWHLSRAEAVKDENGNIKMWIGSNTEIQRLKEEERRKEDFLKMVSHELKTPVTSIKGYVQLLLSLLNKEEDPQKISSLPLKPSLQRIDYQLVRLTRLISEILDLSRIEENKLELQKNKFNINELVDETVQDISYTNTQHKIRINHDLKCEVIGDRDRIGQVLINFITNSIKYSPESQNIDISVNAYSEDEVAVSVKDYGIGIDQQYHKNVFKRFYRIGTEKEDTYSGFGIGLFLANEIIQRHQGFIELKSEKGKGSEFTFVLNMAP